ncbi:MAG: hypothetical protein JSS10_06025 [Verrucomicrobia bacterium]|nr:hypothetical protein [Verrucomicrobiota bacterium]
MALTVRLTSQETVLAVISPSLPSPCLHLRIAIESLCPWDRALITFHRTFFHPRSLSGRLDTHQALERQILKMQLEVQVETDASEENGENLALLSRVENIVRGMIVQKRADFAFAEVRSQKDFQRKKRLLNLYKERALELYFKTDATRLKQNLDHALYATLRGQAHALAQRALENYWNWISEYSWGYLHHWNTEVEMCKRICKSITKALMDLDPREKPALKATYGHHLRTNLWIALESVIIKLGHQQTWNKDVRLIYMMYKVELLKNSLCRMLLWEKLSPLIRPCEEAIQKLSREKKHKKDPLKSAHKEWVKKYNEYDPRELRKVLDEYRFTRCDQIIIQALSLTMGHDLKRTLIEQEILDMDIAEDLTIPQDPGLYLRYQLQMRDEMALRLLSPLQINSS